MYCKIINNKIVNPSNFEGDKEFNLNYYTFINSPDNYFIYDNQIDDIIVNPLYEEEEKQKKIDKFNKEFFNTSLGYVRRSVTMSNGDKKDFLSDLLPTIALGVSVGQQVEIIIYEKPDFDGEILPIENYQHIESVTPQFIQDCFIQLGNDFIQH